MTNQEVLIQEVQDEISAEMPERLRVIQTPQEKEKEKQTRIDQGENGIRGLRCHQRRKREGH